MDPFAQQIQRIESNDKVQQLVEAFRLIPIDDADARDQLEASLEKILTPAAHKIPETQRKITEFTFEEPNLSYHEIAARPKYRPMKHGIHYLDEDNTLPRIGWTKLSQQQEHEMQQQPQARIKPKEQQHTTQN